jgi:hypothetical protein
VGHLQAKILYKTTDIYLKDWQWHVAQHAHRIHSCVSTAKTVTRTRHNVTSYTHCVCCYPRKLNPRALGTNDFDSAHSVYGMIACDVLHVISLCMESALCKRLLKGILLCSRILQCMYNLGEIYNFHSCVGEIFVLVGYGHRVVS